jgi:hypothetical protein
MKKIIIIPLVLLSFNIISCKKESVQPVSLTEQQTLNQDTKMSFIDPGMFVFQPCDDWAIAFFQKNKIDQTANYRSLKFTFCPDNTVILSNDILAVSGNWYFIMDKGNPDYLVLKFNSSISTSDTRPNAFWSDLDDVWKVVKLQHNLVWLKNDVEAKVLVFERQIELN